MHEHPLSNKYFQQQDALSSKVVTEDDFGAVHLVGGADVAYEKNGDRLVAAITVHDARSLKVMETSLQVEKASFPYIPGLFSFRELPPLKKAFAKLHLIPDLLVCDGHGLAHMRRFGLACHLGLELDLPTIGCGKTYLLGEFETPGQEKGSYSDLIDEQDVVGRVVRTQSRTNPVFVSVGHRISLNTATQWILRLAPNYRLPETTRSADQAVKLALKEILK